VSLLVEFEKTTGFHDKGKLKAPDKKGERPVEFADFMQLRCQWDTPFALQTEIGSRTLKDSFAQRWWMWWELSQPAARLETENEWLAPAELDSEEWGDMRKRYGQNGMLLYVGGLFWWGEAAKDDERATELLAEWRVAVEDTCMVLAEVVKGVGERSVTGRDENYGILMHFKAAHLKARRMRRLRPCCAPASGTHVRGRNRRHQMRPPVKRKRMKCPSKYFLFGTDSSLTAFKETPPQALELGALGMEPFSPSRLPCRPLLHNKYAPRQIFDTSRVFITSKKLIFIMQKVH
jgi:hypothetical protein